MFPTGRPHPMPSENYRTGKHSSHNSVVSITGHGDHCPLLDGRDNKVEMTGENQEVHR